MIVGGYDLHLYCASKPCPFRLERQEFQFAARNESEARQAARDAGWAFTSGDVLCPKCTAARRARDS